MDRVELPTGIADFPGEVLSAPRWWCDPVYNITHWTDMPRGGHFAAFEQPEMFVDDVRSSSRRCDSTHVTRAWCAAGRASVRWPSSRRRQAARRR